MNERTNVGYKIIKVVALPHTEFVLGEKTTDSGTKYVTWRCNNHTDYYYGHYIENFDLAMLDLYERVQDEVIFIISQLKEKTK